MPGDLSERLIAASELHGDFVLSSGRRSNVYFDKFRFLTDPDLLKDTAKAVAELLPEGITHVFEIRSRTHRAPLALLRYDGWRAGMSCWGEQGCFVEVRHTQTGRARGGGHPPVPR